MNRSAGPNSHRPSSQTGRRPSERGLSRFEAKLVAAGALGALTVAGLVVHHLSSGERETLSERDAQRILRAAEGHFEHGGQGCPTLTSLRRDRHLDPVVPADDAWGERFRVSCSSGTIKVRSAGPDHRVGSDDDVSVTSRAG